jgi:hypothetical protein
MMLRNLLDEVVRRRLWPILVVAVLVAVAAPLLFLKPSPSAGPVATPAPGTAPAGELPARAKRLLATTSSAGTNAARAAKGSAADPFQAPSSQAKADAAATAEDKPKAAAGATGTAASKPIPVVIANADGSTPTTSGTTTTTTATPQPSNDAPPITSGSVTNVAKRGISVDVRFGKALPSRLHRSIPRLQTFVAGGRVIAIFVKYSPSRRKAVFAIGPNTLVRGDVECRRKQDVCRYVDIPAGKHVRLTTLGSDGSLVTRRLDVVRIGRAPSLSATAASVAAPADGACLLGKLLTLGAKDAPLASDACPN